MAMSIEQFRKRASRYMKEPARIGDIVAAFKKASTRARSATRRGIKGTTMGSTLWSSGKKGGPKLSISKLIIGRLDKGLGATFKIKGLAAMIEAGGKTGPHTIQGYGGGLTFPGTNAFSGRTVTTFEVSHPGSIVRRQATMKPSIEKAMIPFEAELAKAIESHAEKTF
jgi:hypothetical protein